MPQNEHPVALCKDAAVDVNKNLVRILAEQNVWPHISARPYPSHSSDYQGGFLNKSCVGKLLLIMCVPAYQEQQPL